MLKVSGLTKMFGAYRALNVGNIDIPRAQITGIIGPNGAGKTTLFNAIGGALRPSAGTVLLDGGDVTGLSPHRLAQKGLVRTFQISRDLSALTILENLLVARPGQLGEGVVSALFARKKIRAEEEAALDQARSLLQRVDLWRLADQSASSLSGGQKKLLEVLRAMMLSPKLILLDEPAAGVARTMEGVLCDFILELKAEGVTFAIVEHDMEMVKRLCDDIYVLTEGREMMHGTYEQVTTDPRVLNAFLGSMV